MNIQVIQTFSQVTIAIALVSITFQMAALVNQHKILTRVVARKGRPVLNHHVHAHHDDHSAVWSWMDGRWSLLSDDLTMTQAGTPPERPGEFEGECVKLHCRSGVR